MTDQVQNNNSNLQENKVSDKELNFRALEQKYQKALDQERQARLHAEQEAARLAQERSKNNDDDEDDSEPYVDKKKLNKTLQKFGEQSKQVTQSEIQKAIQVALQEERQQNWLKNNSDFQEVMQHAEKLYHVDPELAETILQMPEGFERQKLVYKNLKALGLHKERPKEPSIQEKIDSNRRSPYYQPSSVGSAPYASQGDFSQSGQKNAYDKMKDLQRRLRIS